MTSPLSSIAWARPASASGSRSWISGRMRAGGEMVRQHLHRRRADVGAVVEAVDREQAHRRALRRIGRASRSTDRRRAGRRAGRRRPPCRAAPASSKLRPKPLPPIGSRIRSTPRPRCFAHAGDDILAAVVDRVSAPSPDRCGSSCVRAGDPDHLQPGDQRELHRGAADATRGGIDQHRLASTPRAAVCST